MRSTREAFREFYESHSHDEWEDVDLEAAFAAGMRAGEAHGRKEESKEMDELALAIGYGERPEGQGGVHRATGEVIAQRFREMERLRQDVFIGPCAHGSDPYDRCDTCQDLTPTQAFRLAILHEAADEAASFPGGDFRAIADAIRALARPVPQPEETG